MKRITLVVLLSIINLTIGYYIGRFFERGDTNKIIDPITGQVQKSLKCQHYGFPEEDRFFSTYEVKAGDTLLSIANRQLGDTERVEELIMLNIRKHSSLRLENPFIEVGWELLLPPKIITRSSGSLYIQAGEYVETEDQTNNSIVPNNENVAIIIYDGPYRNSLVSRKTSETKYLGKESFETGDCVFVLVDSGTRHNTALVVTPQDKNYFD